MQRNQYQDKRDLISKSIQELTGDLTLTVINLWHGNYPGQVHIEIVRTINEQTSVKSHLLMLELLEGEIPRGKNIYSEKNITLIIQSLDTNLDRLEEIPADL